MELSAGKFWGMRRLADASGFYKMLAADQRNPIIHPIAEKRGLKNAPYDEVVAVKEALVKALAPLTSAALLDPLYGYARPIAHLPAHSGLIVSLEHSTVADTPGGKKTSAIPDWSVAKIKRMGADAVKVLVWHRHDSAQDVRKHQLDFVKAAGVECRRHDIVFLLEVLVYPLPGEAPDPAKRAERVLAAIGDYASPEFGVDIYKLEAPTALSGVPDPDGADAAAGQALFDRMAKLVSRPWVMLSAGASAADFERLLTYAYRAGASGYLAGRAIWADAFAHFPDMVKMGVTLDASSVPYVRRINALTERLGCPWHKHPGWGGSVTLQHATPDFAKAYGA